VTADAGALFGIPLRTPWPLLRSVGVGGGSVARMHDGELRLGPESMGAFPGPACYDLGSERATLTDALLALGRLDPDGFLGGRRKLSVERARAAIERDLPVEDAAERIVAKGVELVCATAEEMLPDREGFTLFCFGGNGGNFATAAAERLGLDRAVVFQLGPVLSAFGSSVADVCHVLEEFPYGPVDAGLVERMRATVLRDLEGEGFAVDAASVVTEYTVGGRTSAEPAAVVDRVAVRGTVSVPRFDPATVSGDGGQPELVGERAGMRLYRWDDLRPGAVIAGPAVLESDTNTCVIPAGWRLRADEFTNGVLERS
jgi:acetophenone carboxylase